MHFYLRHLGLYVWLIGLIATSAMRIPSDKGLQLEGTNGTVSISHKDTVKRDSGLAFLGWNNKNFREGSLQYEAYGMDACTPMNVHDNQHGYYIFSINITRGYACMLYSELLCTSLITNNHYWPFWMESTNENDRAHLDPVAMSYRCWNASDYMTNFTFPGAKPSTSPPASNPQQASLHISSTAPQTSVSQQTPLFTFSAPPQTPNSQKPSVPIASITSLSKSQETLQSSTISSSTSPGPPTPSPTFNSQITGSPTSSATLPSKSPETPQPSESGPGTSLGMRGWPLPDYKGKVHYWNINMTMGWCHSAAFPNGAFEGNATGEASSIRSLTIETGIVCILFKDSSCTMPFEVNNVTVLFTEYANGGPKSNIPERSAVAYRCWPCSNPNPKDYCGWKPSHHPSRRVKRANLQQFASANSTLQSSHRILM